MPPGTCATPIASATRRRPEGRERERAWRQEDVGDRGGQDQSSIEISNCVSAKRVDAAAPRSKPPVRAASCEPRWRRVAALVSTITAPAATRPAMARDPVQYRRRADRQAQAAKREQPQPERHRVREHDARQVLGRDAPARVEPVPDRRPREHREPDGIRDRVRETRRERDAPPRQPGADVGQREKVIAGEHRVVGEGEGEGEGEAARRRREDVGDELVPADAAQLRAQHGERRQKQHRGNRRRDLDDRRRVSRVKGSRGVDRSIASTRRRSNSPTLSLNR